VDSLGDALTVAQDITTALCGGFNALYFLLYLLRRQETLPRRVGAAALALVNVGALVESLYLSTLYTTYHLGWRGETPFLSPFPWLLARSLPFLGTLFVSLLVLRALSHGSDRKE